MVADTSNLYSTSLTLLGMTKIKKLRPPQWFGIRDNRRIRLLDPLNLIDQILKVNSLRHLYLNCLTTDSNSSKTFG